jgi:addiction module RelE/StbE family toxin
MVTLIATEHFLRRARKFLKQHPELRQRFSAVIADLTQDPCAPHLAYHHLSGQLQGIQAVRLAAGYRITLTIAITEKEIVLLDIGSHAQVYR